jgi:hypothetical protein
VIRRLLRLAALAGVTAAVVAAVRSLRTDKDPLPVPATRPSEPWPPLRPEPTPAPDAPIVKTPEPDGVPVAADPTAGTPSADPTPDGECPDGYPIKGKLTSKIFHAPGQLNYDRTTPDRCYADEAAAEADGLRAAKR